jgi:hypothetical protein
LGHRVNYARHLHALALATGMGPTKADVFIALVTVEGLIFAALSISATLAGGGALGAKTLGPPPTLAVISAILLVLVATAAAFAWFDLFAGPAWSGSSDRAVETIGLLLAIVAQPVIAWVIALGLVYG